MPVRKIPGHFTIGKPHHQHHLPPNKSSSLPCYLCRPEPLSIKVTTEHGRYHRHCSEQKLTLRSPVSTLSLSVHDSVFNPFMFLSFLQTLFPMSSSWVRLYVFYHWSLRVSEFSASHLSSHCPSEARKLD